MLQFNISIHSPTKIYIQQLQVLIQSIFELYGPTANVAVYYTNMNTNEVNLIRRKHFVIFKEVKTDDVKNVASFKLNNWLALLQDCDVKQQVFMDCDMLLFNKLEPFFSTNFDIGFTYKTEKSETLRKPLNTGLILVNKTKKALSFFEWWTSATNELLTSHKAYVGKWGEWDQHTLGNLLNTGDYSQVLTRKGTIFKGFPCKHLNNIVCGELHKDLYVIHYKGMWRNVLPNGTWANSGKDKSKCMTMYNLWKDTLERFNKV